MTFPSYVQQGVAQGQPFYRYIACLGWKGFGEDRRISWEAFVPQTLSKITSALLRPASPSHLLVLCRTTKGILRRPLDYAEPVLHSSSSLRWSDEERRRMEAAAGVEPACKGFADLCLTTWLRRRLLLADAEKLVGGKETDLSADCTDCADSFCPPEAGSVKSAPSADSHLPMILCLTFQIAHSPCVISDKNWSGKRASNPRPSAWEADALPTELFPLSATGSSRQIIQESCLLAKRFGVCYTLTRSDGPWR